MDDPPRHRQPWTDEDLAQAIELMHKGHSNREIAAMIGRTESTTNVAFYRLGLNRGLSHCLNCGTPLDQPEVGRKRRFCSENCRTSDERERRRIDREAAVDPNLPCPHCGNTIPVERQRRGGTYCSRRCSQDAWYRRKCEAAGRTPEEHQEPTRSEESVTS